ncbi:MAG: MFS transporter [Rubellimicrobium sp.]|nr:MFS transporter [Rubellimicrobium sp.]
MRVGIAILILAYGLSQFYRMFLSVLAPALAIDLGADGGDIAEATGFWYLAFAASQIPVGIGLDRYGPRRTVGVLLLIGGAGGGFLVAMAQTVWQLKVAMVLIGIGCGPILISSYFIFARVYPPAIFATLAGATIGVGGLGNIGGTAPLAAAVTGFGWRPTMFALAWVTLLAAALVLAFVRDPERAQGHSGGTFGEVMRIRALWPVFAVLIVSYAAAAGISGGWGGPYFAGVFGADATAIGRSLLLMSAALIAGSFACGPMERLFGGAGVASVVTTAVSVGGLLVLALLPGTDALFSTVLLAVVGFAGANFPLLIAWGKGHLPPHLMARGMTFMNLLSIGGVGLIQQASSPVWTAAGGAGAGADAFGRLFLFFALVQAAGLVPVLVTRRAAR